MRLLVKFNVIFILAFGLGLVATGYVARGFLQRDAREQVLRQARLMMEVTGSTFNYTTSQVGPIIEAHQKHMKMFFPQSIPAYSAGQIFAYVRTRYPEYTYKAATLNPTNLADRAVDWESDVISTFRNDARRTELVGQRATATGESLYLANPIRTDATCLGCHSTPAAAPATMVQMYGPDHGFGWRVGEIVGAQIVSVPMSVPLAIADAGFRNLMLWLAGISVGTLILLNLALIFTVIRPVTRMSAAADAISKGELDVPELPVRGSDEIARLAAAFNRMHRSLGKAMALLG